MNTEMWEHPVTFYLVNPAKATCEFKVQREDGAQVGSVRYAVSELLKTGNLTATVDLDLEVQQDTFGGSGGRPCGPPTPAEAEAKREKKPEDDSETKKAL